jgi:hypothetical protein
MISHPRKENNFLVFSTPLKKKKKKLCFLLRNFHDWLAKGEKTPRWRLLPKTTQRARQKQKEQKTQRNKRSLKTTKKKGYEVFFFCLRFGEG